MTDYCACGRQATGRCATCRQPLCGPCRSSNILAGRRGPGLQKGPALVMCRECDAAEARSFSGGVIDALLAERDPAQRSRLALRSHYHSEGRTSSTPGLARTGHPTFDELRAAGLPLAETATQEIRTLLRSGLLSWQPDPLHVFVGARVHRLVGQTRDAGVHVGSMAATIVRVEATSSEFPVLVPMVVRGDGALLSPNWPRTDGSGHTIATADGNRAGYPARGRSLSSGEFTRLQRAAAAELERLQTAPTETDEFDVAHRSVMKGAPPSAFAEFSLFRALYARVGLAA